MVDPIIPAFWLQALDYCGVAVFAATGALAAARRRHDFVTFAFFAAVTGVGGGTVRDVLIGTQPFWVVNPAYLLVSLAAAAAVWLTGPRSWRFPALLWLDALGMAAYAVMGAAKALAFGVAPGAAVVMGVLTATFGGVLRDVLANEPSVLLRREIYVTAALLASGLFVALDALGAPFGLSSAVAFASGFALRGVAIWKGWSLPEFKAPEDQA